MALLPLVLWALSGCSAVEDLYADLTGDGAAKPAPPPVVKGDAKGPDGADAVAKDLRKGQYAEALAGAEKALAGAPDVDTNWDLIELITAESSAPGQRHAHLAGFVGELALYVWVGEPGDFKRQVSGVNWVRAAEWVPYQKRNFVTPAFPGFTSGHSTFSRAAAEVMTLATGSAYVPGGLGEAVVPKDTALTFEKGPSVAFKLQWATWYDAADQAGQSRLWGGIHIEPDDFVGRRTGGVVGAKAFAKAETYFR
jgi:hypothetical protein